MKRVKKKKKDRRRITAKIVFYERFFYEESISRAVPLKPINIYNDQFLSRFDKIKIRITANRLSLFS